MERQTDRQGSVVENTLWRKEASLTMVLGNLDFNLQKDETRSLPLTLLNYTCIKDLSVRPEPLKPLEERVESASGYGFRFSE